MPAALGSTLLWKPLFEAVGQTITGALGTYALGKATARIHRDHSFEGPMDLWHRGIHGGLVHEGDSLRFEGLISPFTQLFPGDPFQNAQRWNALHAFPGRITSSEYQSLEFFAGSDAALRVGSLNGESLVGLFGRYGFIGEGLVGVVATSLLRKTLPDFFTNAFVGTRALVKGRVARCPSQHGFIAQAIALRAGIQLNWRDYKNLNYLQIDSIKPYKALTDNTFSLLGSMWAATELPKHQYLVQYGYLSNAVEREACASTLMHDGAWKSARVYCDEASAPSQELSFRRAFL